MAFNNISTSDHSSSGYIESPAGRIRSYDDDFMMYQFKVFPCRTVMSHDWNKCKFYHSSERARRHDPRKYNYSALQCSKFRNIGSCDKGDSCEFAHGLFESMLHPGKYRTKLCRNGLRCGKNVCFYAHNEQELRPIYTDTNCAESRLPSQIFSAAMPVFPDHIRFLASQDSPFTLPRSNGISERNVGITLGDEVSSSWPWPSGKVQTTVESESHLSRLNARYNRDFSSVLNQYAQDSPLTDSFHSRSQSHTPVNQSSLPQSHLLLNKRSLPQSIFMMNQSSEPRSSSLMNQNNLLHPPSPSVLYQNSQPRSPSLLHQNSRPPSPEATSPNATAENTVFGTFSQFGL